jgi:RNA methyltransferase, TrmH family
MVYHSQHRCKLVADRVCNGPQSMTTRAKHPSTIDNRHHPLLQLIPRLRFSEERRRSGLFYIEGLRNVEQAVKHHAHIEALIVCYSLLRLPFAQKLVRHERRKGTLVVEVTPNVMYGLGQLEDPQGIGAILRQHWQPLSDVKAGNELCWLALQTVRSPGNLGSILRTSDAVGGAGLIVLGKSIDPYDPATVRATMGALFRQQFVGTSESEFRRWKKRSPFLLVGTSPSAPVDYHSLTYQAPTILLMGGERKGLPLELESICDVMVRIPMVGQNDSLNLAVATSIMLRLRASAASLG